MDPIISVSAAFKSIKELLARLEKHRSSDAQKLALEIDRRVLEVERHCFALEQEIDRLETEKSRDASFSHKTVGGYRFPVPSDDSDALHCPTCHSKGLSIPVGPIQDDGTILCPNRQCGAVYDVEPERRRGGDAVEGEWGEP